MGVNVSNLTPGFHTNPGPGPFELVFRHHFENQGIDVTWDLTAAEADIKTAIDKDDGTLFNKAMEEVVGPDWTQLPFGTKYAAWKAFKHMAKWPNV